MMKMKIAAVLAAVMIGSAALPTVTAFAYGNDPAETTAEAIPEESTEAVTSALETESVKETSADAVTAETEEKDSAGAETETVADSEETADNEASETGESDLSGLDLSQIPGIDASLFTDILSDMDPEVVEVLLKNPKLLAYFLPTLHVTVTDTSVTIAVDGDEPEENPVRTGHVRTNGSNLNVRTGPGIDFDIINKLANGTEVQVTKEENGWYQLEFPAKYGYVCGQYLELNDITPEETPEGYTFDIDGEMMASFLSLFSGMLEEDEPVTVPDIHGLTPDGNLSLVDDIGPVTGEGQQFVTLVTKAGNYFYLIIDRDEKGEETVHFLNLVDERDLFSLMEEDEQASYTEQLAAEQAAKEAAEKAAAEAATAESGEGDEAKTDKDKESGKSRNILPLLLIPVILAAAGGGWFFMQTKKKKQEAEKPDPDADYTNDDEEDYGAGEGYEEPVSTDDTADTDPYEDEILGDDEEEPEEEV